MVSLWIIRELRGGYYCKITMVKLDVCFDYQ